MEPSSVRVPEPVGEAQEGADDALGGFVEGEALQPLLVVQAALDEHLQQSDAEAGLPLDLFLDLAAAPGHEGDVVERERPLGVLAGSEQGTLAEEIVGGEDVDDGLCAVVEGDGDLDPSLHDKVQAVGGLVFVEDDLTFAVNR